MPPEKNRYPVEKKYNLTDSGLKLVLISSVRFKFIIITRYSDCRMIRKDPIYWTEKDSK